MRLNKDLQLWVGLGAAQETVPVVVQRLVFYTALASVHPLLLQYLGGQPTGRPKYPVTWEPTGHLRAIYSRRVVLAKGPTLGQVKCPMCQRQKQAGVSRESHLASMLTASLLPTFQGSTQAGSRACRDHHLTISPTTAQDP
jgi:hypothetical protein